MGTPCWDCWIVACLAKPGLLVAAPRSRHHPKAATNPPIGRGPSQDSNSNMQPVPAFITSTKKKKILFCLSVRLQILTSMSMSWAVTGLHLHQSLQLPRALM